MEFLSNIVNAVSFRPQQWRKKPDKEQLDEVFNFFPELKNKITEHDNKISELQKKRAGVLSKNDVLRVDISRLSYTEGLPSDEINPASIIKKLNDAKNHNSELEGLKESERDIREDISSLTTGIDNKKKEKKEAEEMIEKLREQIRSKEKDISQMTEERGLKLKMATDMTKHMRDFKLIDIEPINKEVDGLKEKNDAIRNNNRIKEINGDIEHNKTEAYEIYHEIEKEKAKKSNTMSSLDIDIGRISIGENCLTYPNSSMDMVPLSSLSDGEFWPVSIDLVAAFNPKVAIIIVDDYWALDDENFELLCSSAKKHAMQVWIHKTLKSEDNYGGGFLIRGGEIVKK